MGAVGYTSAVSERDYYLAEQAREQAEIDAIPEAERAGIRDIYAAKGFTGGLLDRVVDTITANRDRWLSTMMDEELHLQPVQAPKIIRLTLRRAAGHRVRRDLAHPSAAAPPPGHGRACSRRRPARRRGRAALGCRLCS
jgi:VIT family